VVDAVCSVDELNPFGAVTGGFIKLRGWLLPALITKPASISNARVHYIGSQAVASINLVDQIGLISTSQSQHEVNSLKAKLSTAEHSFDTIDGSWLDTEDDWESVIREPTFCLPVATSAERLSDVAAVQFFPTNCREQTIIFNKVYCLILARNLDGLYHRIGIVVFHDIVAWKDVVSETEITII
jgi:hypothetical protein